MKRLFAAFAAVTVVACSAAAPPPEAPKTPAEVPITSKSSEAIDHFKKGRDFADNQRPAEAAQEFDLALKADPDFVFAQAFLGNVTPGLAGLKLIEQANTKAAS